MEMMGLKENIDWIATANGVRYQRDGVAVGASASQSVDLGFIP